MKGFPSEREENIDGAEPEARHPYRVAQPWMASKHSRGAAIALRRAAAGSKQKTLADGLWLIHPLLMLHKMMTLLCLASSFYVPAQAKALSVSTYSCVFFREPNEKDWHFSFSMGSDYFSDLGRNESHDILIMMEQNGGTFGACGSLYSHGKLFLDVKVIRGTGVKFHTANNNKVSCLFEGDSIKVRSTAKPVSGRSDYVYAIESVADGNLPFEILLIIGVKPTQGPNKEGCMEIVKEITGSWPIAAQYSPRELFRMTGSNSESRGAAIALRRRSP